MNNSDETRFIRTPFTRPPRTGGFSYSTTEKEGVPMADQRDAGPRGNPRRDRWPRRDQQNRPRQDNRRDQPPGQGQGQPQQGGGGGGGAIVTNFRIVERAEQDGHLTVTVCATFSQAGRPLTGRAGITVPQTVEVLTSRECNLDLQGEAVFSLRIPVTDPLQVPVSIQLDRPQVVCNGVITGVHRNASSLMLHREQSGGNDTITAVVRDENGRPFPGATVLSRDAAAADRTFASATTDENGIVVLTFPVREQEGRIIVLSPAIAESEQTVVLPPVPRPATPAEPVRPRPARFEPFFDRHEGGQYRFYATVHAEDGTPCEGVQVLLIDANPQADGEVSALTDAQGIARLGERTLPPGFQDVIMVCPAISGSQKTKQLFGPGKPKPTYPPIPWERNAGESIWSHVLRVVAPQPLAPNPEPENERR